ncbi:MAG: endonuclease [Lachnospiraceae bacterium]|nr:endonuclease [Lachnospiraceae bacterium]
MKNKWFRKNLLASLLTLVMVLSLIPSNYGLKTASAATTDTGALHYNKGHRDTVATELSDAAKDYYKNFAYNYADIKDNAEAPDGAALKSALTTLMQSTLEKQVSYSSLPTYWAYSDAEDGKPGTIYFYSDVSTNEYSASLNREHVWAKSHASFQEQFGGADLHHLRPAIDKVNSFRSSYVMGEINEATASSYSIAGKKVAFLANNTFEPLENVKGDVARIFLYVYTCWNQPNLFQNVPAANLPAFDPDDSKNDGQKVIESLATLLQWCYDDPVDTWEMEQNDIIETVQGNRNVFIDYPEYAWMIFGLEVPEGIASPASGNAVKGTYKPGDLSGIGGDIPEVIIDENEAVSFAEAATMNGQTVTLVGQVSYIYGNGDQKTTAIITDENGDGFQLYFGNSAFGAGIGDVIAVNGSVTEYHGVKQLGGINMKTLTEADDAATLAAPAEVTVAELLAAPDAYLNKRVEVKNVVIGKKDGDSLPVTQTVDGVESTIYIYQTASLPSGIAATDTVDIVALASKRDADAQLRVGESTGYTRVAKGERVHYDLTTEAGILEAAFSLETGASLGQAVTLTGEITSIKTAYSAQYNNISVNIKVADKTIQGYRLAGGSELKVGDVITVTGDITNYNGTIEFVAGSTYVPAGGATPTAAPTAVPTTAPTSKPTTAPTSVPTVVPEGNRKFVKINSIDELEAGASYIFYGVNSSNATPSEFAMGNVLSSNRPVGVAVDVADDTIVTDNNAIIWTVEEADGVYYLVNAESGKYLTLKNNSTKPFVFESTPSSGYTVSAEDGNFSFLGTAVNRILSIYATDFRAYTPGGVEIQALNLYKEAVSNPEFAKITSVSEIGEEGQFVIYGHALNGDIEGAMNNVITSKQPGVTAVEFTENGTIAKDQADESIVWTLKKNEDGTYSIFNEALGKYLVITESKTSSFALADTATSVFNVLAGDNGFQIADKQYGRGIVLYSNSFRAYATSTNDPRVELYRLGGAAEGTTPVVTPTPVPTATSTPVPTATPVPTEAPDLTTEEGILKAAFELKADESLGQAVTLTGTIVKINTAYSTQYKNITVTIKVADKEIQCFRLAGGEDLAVGDEITVTGDITNYKGTTVEFVAGSTYVKKVVVTPTPVPTATSTPTPTATSTPVPTATNTPTPTATNTPVPTTAPVETPEVEGNYKMISSAEELGEGGLVVFYGISGQDGSVYAMGNKLSSSRPLGVEVEMVDGVIANPDANIVWSVTKTEDGTYTLRNAATGKYLNLDKDSTKPFTLADTAVPYTLLDATDGNFQFQSTVNARILSIYINDFRAYGAGAKEMGTIKLYKLTEDVVIPEEPVIDITAQEVSSWGDMVQTTITVSNISDKAIKSWKANVYMNGEIQQIWSADLLGEVEGGYVIGCPAWKQNLEVGESYTFGVIVKKNAEELQISAVELVSEEKETEAANYNVSFNKNAWSYGFNGEVVIKNIGEAAIANWTIEFDYADEITNIWNAVIVSHEGTHYVITNAGWNSTIYANGAVSFGFSGRPAEGEFSAEEISNATMTSVQ